MAEYTPSDPPVSVFVNELVKAEVLLVSVLKRTEIVTLNTSAESFSTRCSPRLHPLDSPESMPK